MAAGTACRRTPTSDATSPSVDDAEITANRNGASSDPKASAAVRFAAQIVNARGHVTDEELAAVSDAGFSPAEIVEIVLTVALNTFTNYVNEVAKTDIDFPVVSTHRAAA
jgi:alkylhydroperoxidase family enzyme